MTVPPRNRDFELAGASGADLSSSSSASECVNWQAMAEHMVRTQLATTGTERAGIRNERVLAAFRAINRALFVPPERKAEAFADRPLPIGFDQTISQPYMVAAQLEVLDLRGHERVLEIGTGSGYQTALLSRLAREVYSVERISQLLNSAARILHDDLQLAHVKLRLGDGTLGWPEFAPFDAIVVSAGAPEIPLPLANQLAIGGRMAIPVQVRDPRYDEQQLVLVHRVSESDFESRSLMGCRFVKLYGEAGWNAANLGI